MPEAALPRTDAEVDAYLFRNGLRLEDYFLDKRGAGEIVGYRSADGREMYLMIDHPRLEASLKARLRALGVKVLQAD